MRVLFIRSEYMVYFRKGSYLIFLFVCFSIFAVSTCLLSFGVHCTHIVLPSDEIQLQHGPKTGTLFYILTPYALTSSNIDRFSNVFHCLNQEKIRINIVTKDPTTPKVCRYTTLWNVIVFKATTENKTTSVATHFKKLTTGNNVHIVSSYYPK